MPSGQNKDNPKLSGVFDCIVVGAGIAGVSVACELAQDRTVLLLEAESQPGYHATGRSAAFFTEAYGNKTIRALTAASRAFFERPPAGFATHPLLTPRGALYIGRADQRGALEAFFARRRTLIEDLVMADATFARQQVPVLKEAYVDGCVFEPGARQIDVHALLQGYLRGLKSAGGTLLGNARVEAAERVDGHWQVRAGGRRFQGRLLIDAAGAWADEVAVAAGAAPCGLQPLRRSVCIVAMPDGMDCHRWPAMADVEDHFYCVPDNDRLLLSPADETPVVPADACPEDLDIALAVDRLETATTLNVRRVIQQWAGLRTFAPDRTPVVGFDTVVEDFFWLAGQGGYGIQTAPALSRCAASLVRGEGIPAGLNGLGVTDTALDPGRIQEKDSA